MNIIAILASNWIQWWNIRVSTEIDGGQALGLISLKHHILQSDFGWMVAYGKDHRLWNQGNPDVTVLFILDTSFHFPDPQFLSGNIQLRNRGRT